MSKVYCVVLDDTNDSDEVWDTIEVAYPDAGYNMPPDGVFLVDTDDSAQEVAVRLGLRPADEDEGTPRLAGGIVLRVNGQYSGYTYQRLLSWLNVHRTP